MRDEIAIITAEQMKNLIYEIRGQKVMLDVDLAKIYGYKQRILIDRLKTISRSFLMILCFN